MSVTSVEIKGDEEVRQLIGTLPDEVFDNAKVIFRKNTLELQKKVVDNITTGKMRRRSGNLARSIQPSVRGSNLGNLEGSVASLSTVRSGGESVDVVYAPIHEFGGTIRAKSGGALTIPTNENKTAAGVMRLSAREVIRNGGFISRGMIFGASGVPTHILKKSVEIPARLGMIDAGEKQVVVLTNDIKANIFEGIK